MAKIMLFGSGGIAGIPQDVMIWLKEYTTQGHEFIVGDKKGCDSAFHKALSSVGATNVTIYCMDSPKNNTYEHPAKCFTTYYDESKQEVTIQSNDNTTEPYIISGVEKEMDIPNNREWYEFRDKQLIRDCDIAIGIWDGENKTTTHIAQLLGIYNKPCYMFTVQ